MKKLFKILISFFAFCFFTFAVVTPVNMVGNWYQQFMPDLSGQPISDIFFIDSSNGWAVTDNNTPNDSGYILKTTNGGDNWVIKLKDRRDFSRIKFINSNTGFTCGGTGSGTPYIYKSTNGGESWFVLSMSGCAKWRDMYVLNNDTIWLIDTDSFCGGVFRTTNGGTSWGQQFGQGPEKIYFFNGLTGYVARNTVAPYVRKTTDGGASWNIILNGEGFRDIYFIDENTGWRAWGNNMYKSTNGGINWITQILPQGGIILSTGVFEFSNINTDTIFAVGGEAFFGAGQFRGIIYRTTNGGNNWQFQIPDTTIHSSRYLYLDFTNKRNGWAYWGYGGVHTTTSGDTVWLTAVKQISSEVPKNFNLYQNYPNPFNPTTVIKYQILKNNYVNLIIYDVTGKQVIDLVNKKQSAGTYQVDFSANNISSGIYFYSLIIEGKHIDTKKMMFIK